MQSVRTLFLTAAALSLSLALPALAYELEGENLLQSLPTGYKVVMQERVGDVGMTEMVPASESAQDWTEMLTTQLFFGMKQVSPLQFQARMAGLPSMCSDGSSIPVADGEEGGYPFAVWLLACPPDPSTGKPEFVYLKAIQGNDTFYVVQKAFRFEPAGEQVAQWAEYLRGVTVCDTRLSDRACPNMQRAQ